MYIARHMMMSQWTYLFLVVVTVTVADAVILPNGGTVDTGPDADVVAGSIMLMFPW